VTTSMDVDPARAIADAVLYEGYLLYPYRASAAKNQVRWQWGVLMPPSYADSGTGEHAWCRTELVAEPSADAVLHVRLRFLRLQERIAEEAPGRPVAAMTVGGVEHTTWEEAVEQEVDAVVPFTDIIGADVTVPFTVPGGEDVDPVPGGDEQRLVRRRHDVSGELTLRADPLSGPFGGVRLVLLVTNVSTADDRTRAEALRHALIAAHSLLSLSGGHFLSVTDPPEWALVATRECRSERSWPVLVGAADQRDTVLCTPIILPDHPQVAEQSAGNLFDGTEIDEILTLRTMTLTDEEKREARATDPRAAEIIDRVDSIAPQTMAKLHGAVRSMRPLASGTGAPTWWSPEADASVAPERDTVEVDGVTVGRGSLVRLRPGRRADAQDMFLAGRVARVEGVFLDVEDRCYVAVSVLDDPGADLHVAQGRFLYFDPDELEPLPGPA
jgi:hypothetical protein